MPDDPRYAKREDLPSLRTLDACRTCDFSGWRRCMLVLAREDGTPAILEMRVACDVCEKGAGLTDRGFRSWPRVRDEATARADLLDIRVDYDPRDVAHWVRELRREEA